MAMHQNHRLYILKVLLDHHDRRQSTDAPTHQKTHCLNSSLPRHTHSSVLTSMRVVVSGAGIAGPTVAWFLAKAGARVTVVEKATSMLAQGQNIDIRGTAVNILNKMGLLDEVRKHNTTEIGSCLIDRNGRSFARMPVNGSAGSPTSEFEILRGDLAAVLYDAVKDVPNIEFKFGTTVAQVLANDAEKVRVELSTGEEADYDILIVSDGQWSRLRKQLFGQDAVTVVDKNCFCMYATVPRTEEDSDWWELYFSLNRRCVSTRPDNHGTLRCLFSIMPLTDNQKQAWAATARSYDRKLQLDLLKSEFSGAGWKTSRLLQDVEKSDDVYVQAVQQIRMTSWHKNRVICLGDTAYAPTPLTGMGTSLAINGAYLLAGHLSQLKPDQHPSKAFESYESEFRPFVQKIQDVPWFVPGVVHVRYAWQRWLLQHLIAAVAYVVTIPWVARWAATKDRHLDKGLITALDAPFPQFAAFEQVQANEA